MILRCRAQVSNSCYDGREVDDEQVVDDGTYDGETIICDACYIKIGMPSVPVQYGSAAAIEHMDEVLDTYKQHHRNQGSK